MELLFLVLGCIVFLALDTLLKNMWWIGCILILAIVISFIKQYEFIRDFGLDLPEFLFILFKLAAIAGIIWIMVQ